MLKFDWNILFTLGNILIFYIIMKKFFFGKIMKTMDARKELIANKFKEADDDKTEALELKQQYEEQIQNAEEESNRIISEAREKAASEYGKIIDKAEADANELKMSAKADCEEEHKQMLNSAKEDILSLAMETAEKIISSNISDKTNSKIYDEFLNEGSDS